MNRILVLAPHPDDESIGCGGTLCHHIEQGDAVHVVFLSSGEKGGHGRPEAETIRVREQEARNAARILGVPHVEFWREPDGAVRATQSAVTRLRGKLARFRPHTIYVSHNRDMHADHRGAVRLLSRALKGWRGKSPVVFMYEIWTPVQQLDQVVDISPYLNKKLAAVRAYRSQCAVIGLVAAVRGLNRYRGEMHSWPGGAYAEAFTQLKP